MKLTPSRLRPWLALAAVAAGSALCTSSAAAHKPKPPPTPDRPLVHVIAIDGLDGDYVPSELTPRISALVRGEGARSTYYRESRSVMPPSTDPNHTAMATGAYADTSGIPANGFALYGKTIAGSACTPETAFDLSVKPLFSNGDSADCLRVPTIFESLDRQDPGLTTTFITGKPKLSRLFAGRSGPGAPRYIDHLWNACGGGFPDEAYCDSKVPSQRGYVTDAVAMDEVIRTIEQGVGPEKKRPDLTFASLSFVDVMGHNLPGPLTLDTIREADRQVGRLVDVLRARGEWQRSVLLLVSDHSMELSKEKASLTQTLLKAGIPESGFTLTENSNIAYVYVPRVGHERFELLAKMRKAALTNPVVEGALYREYNPRDGGRRNTLDSAKPGWHLAGDRTGDLVVWTKPEGVFVEPTLETGYQLPGNHGGPSTRDNLFAVVGGGRFVRQADVRGKAAPDFDDTERLRNQAENVDVAATVAGLLGRFAPTGNQGRFLSEAFDLSALPGGGRPPAPTLDARRLWHGLVALSWADGGVHDLEVKLGRHWVSVLRETTKTDAVVPATDVRLRAVAASGVAGPWRTLSFDRW